MRDASDAGTLAAAAALTKNNISRANATKIVLDYLKANSPRGIDFSSDAMVRVSYIGPREDRVYRVTVVTRYQYPLSSMTAFLGIADETISTRSTAVSGEKTVGQTPLSVYLVLDRSGSMKDKTTDGTVKLDDLKQAVAEMGNEFAKIDPDKKYVRTGADAFSSKWVPPVNLDWGSTHVVKYANKFTPSGFTIPIDALDQARKSLISPEEIKAHAAKNGGVPKKVLIYMTDGRNWLHDHQTDEEQVWIDTQALNRCKAAKRAGIEVFTIGFDVDEHAQDYLTSCSSGRDHFYFPSGASALISTFKNISNQVSTVIQPRIAR